MQRSTSTIEYIGIWMYIVPQGLHSIEISHCFSGKRKRSQESAFNYDDARRLVLIRRVLDAMIDDVKET